MHSFTGYRKGDKGTKEIQKGRKEIRNEDVEECTPRLIPAVPSDLHTALLTKMFSQGVLSENFCDVRQEYHKSFSNTLLLTSGTTQSVQ